MKSSGEGRESVTLMDDLEIQEVPVQCTHIEFCGEHYQELMNALLERGLHSHISSCAEEMVDKLEKGVPDVGLEATSAITSSAMQLFGPEHVVQMGGCPLCAFSKIIDHVADNLAAKYLRSN